MSRTVNININDTSPLANTAYVDAGKENKVYNKDQVNELVEDLREGTLGSITPSQTLQQLNALPDGNYYASEAGNYAFGTNVPVGWQYRFNKTGTAWKVLTKVEMPMQDLTDLENRVSLTGKNSDLALNLNFSKSIFPYNSATDFNKIIPFTNIVLDCIISNQRVGFAYSIGHIQINITSGERTLRIYRSQDGGITNTLILSKTYYALGDNLYKGSGIEFTDDDIISGGVIYENIKLCINVRELIKITSNQTNVYANNYPLSPLILKGQGSGLIKSLNNETNFIGLAKSNWKIFPYDTSVNSSTLYINNAIKSIKIYGYNSSRYYFLTSIVNNPNSIEILVQSSSDEDRTVNILNAVRLKVNPRETGIKTYISNGSNFASKVEITINWDYLNTVIGKHENRSSVKNLKTKIELIENYKSGQILKLKDIDYINPIGFDNCVLKKGINPTFALNEFHLLQNNESYSRINTNGSTIIEEDGNYTLRLALYQPATSNPNSDSINYYLTDVKFPDLPPSLSNSINQHYTEEGIIDFKHPEIIDLENHPIGGYQYWITTSTHPYQNDSYEDESIYVSNDFSTWLRVRAYNEDYVEGIHAVNITMPPQNLVKSKSVESWNQFLPSPRVGDTINVNGSNKVISKILKHDPMFTYDREEGAIYWVLTYNFAFTDDTSGKSAAESNKFNICIRTTDAINWFLVRSDGSTVLLDLASKTDLFFSQTDNKNNYLRWIDHGLNEIGGSLVFYSNQWWCFHGVNGSLIYKNNKIFNVYQSTPIVSQADLTNHPSHFVYQNKIYRWGAKGIYVMESDYKFTLLPINSMFNGYKGEESQYKKCLFVNSKGEGFFAVSENQESYKSLWNMPNSIALGKRGHLTIGKLNVEQMISAAYNLKKGYYVSVELFLTEDSKVKKYRVPFINKGIYSNSHPITRIDLLTNLSLKKGQQIAADATIIGYDNVSVGISDVFLIK